MRPRHDNKRGLNCLCWWYTYSILDSVNSLKKQEPFWYTIIPLTGCQYKFSSEPYHGFFSFSQYNSHYFYSERLHWRLSIISFFRPSAGQLWEVLLIFLFVIHAFRYVCVHICPCRPIKSNISDRVIINSQDNSVPLFRSNLSYQGHGTGRQEVLLLHSGMSSMMAR